MAQSNDLQTTLDDVFDYLYANGPVRTPTGIWEEVQKVLRTGIFIERRDGIAPAFSFTKNELSKLTRFDNEGTSALVSQVRNAHARMMNQDHAAVDDSDIVLDDQNLATICRALRGIPLSSPDIDVLGEALEAFRHNWTKRNGGQFFTDPAITKLAVELLQFDPLEGEDLVDLAAGTGGFLIAAANRVKDKLLRESPATGSAEADFSSLVKDALKGIEIDQSLADIANMTIGSRIGDRDVRLVTVGDSLNTRNRVRFAQSGIVDSAHLCAATNPPFGSKIMVRDSEILDAYETSRIRSTNGATSQPRATSSPTSLDILFLERNIRILKPGEGRLAIVLPYQLTSGPQALPIRRWLLCNATLEAVVDLPSETFQPYTGTKTCLVLLRRRLEPLSDPSLACDRPVFMSVPKWIGHDRRGKRVFKKTHTGQSTGELLSDIGEVSQAFQAFCKGISPTDVHTNSFEVPADQVFQDPELRFNARYYQPNHLFETITILSKSPTWKILRLGDVAESIFFPGRSRRRYVEQSSNAIPFLGGTNISQFPPILDKWISKDDPMVDEFLVRPGWILITRSGSTGIVSSVPAQWAGWAVSEHVIRVVPNPELLHPGYLEAYLRTKFAKASIQRGIFGSVIDEITPKFLSEICIPVPVSEEMKERIVDASIKARAAREYAIELTTQTVEILEKEIGAGTTTPRFETVQ